MVKLVATCSLPMVQVFTPDFTKVLQSICTELWPSSTRGVLSTNVFQYSRILARSVIASAASWGLKLYQQMMEAHRREMEKLFDGVTETRRKAGAWWASEADARLPPVEVTTTTQAREWQGGLWRAFRETGKDAVDPSKVRQSCA